MGFEKTCDEHKFLANLFGLFFTAKYPETVSKLHSNIMQIAEYLCLLTYTLLFLLTYFTNFVTSLNK